MREFTHLHVHTQYSLLDGAARIEELVARAKELDMHALAITDHGAMYGVVEFYKACERAGVKPILGMEAYVAPRQMTDREGKQDREYAHLVLLCKNQIGYQNLMLLSSEAFLHGFYYRPRIDYDLLEQHCEGLICLSACLAGDIPQRILMGAYDEAKQIALRLKRMFQDDFYIELQNHGLNEQLRVLPGLVQLARELEIPLVATNDVHYVEQRDAKVQDVLLCIQTNHFVDDENRMRMGAEEFYLKSPEQMCELFEAYPDATENTVRIAEKCDVKLRFGEPCLPGFTAPDGMDNETYLRHLCQKGFEEKLPQADQAARERLDYELNVIVKMGFVDYFLIVWDFIHFAKTRGIVVGPGRGSGAGSLAAYCLDITDVNPIQYGLLFERFLNPERISMPDFDVDFCYERRQEVIDYVVEKYGADHVAQIITFGTMAARAVLRDVGRALHMPYQDVDRIVRMVPGELNMTLKRALSVSPQLRESYEHDETVQQLLDLGLKLEGLPRHASTHAAGVVISRLPIMQYVPLQRNDEAVTTQFPMGTLEELGLLKMDFLGLRTLTVIRDTLDLIRASGKDAPNLERMQYDDPKVYDMIGRAETDGVFQLESSGMRQFLMQLKPTCFEDIIAGISLFRPGPMAQIPRYVAAKNKTHAVTYVHEKLRPILENTYGCMVYQEQVMEIVRSLAGYSLGRSDLVRRAMSKKKPDVMAKEREYFVYGIEGQNVPGAVKNGVPVQVANQIFDEMMDFASYAFNKSHAAAYAVLAYRTAYLKYHYQVEFFAALINSFLSSSDKVAEYVYTVKRLGITVYAPDINKSMARFGVENGGIRFGLAAVRNVGSGVMEHLVHERAQNGPFKDFFDFIDRTQGLNKRMVESLIYAGCFDAMGVKRSQLLAVYENAIDLSAQERKMREQGQISLFDLGGVEQSSVRIPLPQLNEIPHNVLLMKEREAIGIYISGHPLDDYQHALAGAPYTVADLQQADDMGTLKDEQRVSVGGMIASVRQKTLKSGNGIMGYATLEGVTGVIELVLFARVLQQYPDLLYPQSPVKVSGKLNIRDDQINCIVVEKIVPLRREVVQKKVFLRLEDMSAYDMEPLKALLKAHAGTVQVVVFDAVTRKQLTSDEFNVDASDAFLACVRKLLGEENVKVVEKETSAV